MIERIKKLMNKRSLTPSQFADEIGLKRSSLSHILSGRNNPSLDVVMKIKSRFEEINTDWLIFGTGSEIMKKESSLVSGAGKKPMESKQEVDGQQMLSFEKTKSETPASEIPAQMPDFTEKHDHFVANKKADPGKSIRLLVIYGDQTFESFESR